MTDKEKIKLIQARVGTTADGIIGPKTLNAIMSALLVANPPAAIEDATDIPTQAQVRSGKSLFGQPGVEGNLTNIKPPYPLYYEGRQVPSIRVHRAVGDRVKAAMREILEHYGIEEIHRLGLDIYGGSYNYRTTSSGKAMSMHAWGIALDFDPEHNAYSTKAPQATLSRPDRKAFVDIWEKHGFINLGRHAGYDWMHFQCARLS